MEREISLADILSKLKTNPFVLNCRMPIGYAAGIPMIEIVRDRILLQVPYWKCIVTGEKGKNLVYPIKYIITLEFPSLRPVKFTNLAYENSFSNTEFDKVVGLFPSPNLKGVTKAQYEQLKISLYEQFDKYINSKIQKTEYSDVDREAFKSLLTKMIEPCHLGFYSNANINFYEEFLK